MSFKSAFILEKKSGNIVNNTYKIGDLIRVTLKNGTVYNGNIDDIRANAILLDISGKYNENKVWIETKDIYNITEIREEKEYVYEYFEGGVI